MRSKPDGAHGRWRRIQPRSSPATARNRPRWRRSDLGSAPRARLAEEALLGVALLVLLEALLLEGFPDLLGVVMAG